MFLVAICVLILISVPLAGGSLSKLADLSLRWPGLILAALVLQVVIISVVPDGNPTLHRALHLLSYGLAFTFLVVNRRVPGLLVIGFGALSNAIVIFANNGVMPASVRALRAAGQLTDPKGFMNSGVLPHPKLPFLGDIFAIPKFLPLHNVFSIGDVCIAVGAAIAIHTLCGSSVSRRVRAVTRGRAARSSHGTQAADRSTPAR